MECFATLHSTVTKNQNTNTRKFQKLEHAHNDLATKVANSTNSTMSRLESLETKLHESQLENTKLATKITHLEDEQNLQRRVNVDNDSKFNALEEDQGFTKKNLYDCSSETKEKKLVISAVPESPGEDIAKIALENINRVIEAAIAAKDPDAHLGGLRKLHRGSIDNVFRIGKVTRGPYSLNISVTFLRYDDKAMVLKAKSDIKGDSDVKIFFNEDISADGRTLKTQLKRIAEVAKSQGKEAKVTGNKVMIDSRPYYSNELSMIPTDVAKNLKCEKHINDGIIFKGEKSIFSNFYPARFNHDGTVYQHVEQFYQHSKAIHHKEFHTANRTALQDELIASHGKQLYEATTDHYFGCGISFESQRWAKHDWPGENVAGLILMKVREELLGVQPEKGSSNNTLVDMAVDDDLSTSVIMEPEVIPVTRSSSSADTQGNVVNVTSRSTQSQRNSDEFNLSQIQRSNTSKSSVPPEPHSNDHIPHRYSSQSNDFQSSQYSRGSSRRGRGRGRGRSYRGNNNNQQRHFSAKPRKPQGKMSHSDRDFLCGNSVNGNKAHVNTIKSSSPRDTNRPNQLGLNAQQLKGLALLGLSLQADATK